jgi:enoyl-CoA hydratase/carnithine racemase
VRYRFIELERRDEIVTIRMKDLANKNAVSARMNEELADSVARVESDDSARVLILTGSEKIFCSGANMKAVIEAGRLRETSGRNFAERLFPHREGIRRVVLALHECSKPTIAAINGAAIGSGVGLAAGCDVRLAASDAKLGWVFTRRGIIPDDGSLALVVRLVGYGNAYLWGITGGVLSAEEALRMGFLQEVLPPEELMGRAKALAAQIIENVPPLTARLFKAAVRADFDHRLTDAIDFAALVQAVATGTADHAEAVRAYAERRRPRWTGA